MIGNREHDPCVAVEGQIYLQLRSLRGILDRVIENVEDGGTQVLRVADDRELPSRWIEPGIDGEVNRCFLQVITLQHGANAIADYLVEGDRQADLVARSLAHLSRLEHLLHSRQEPLCVREHDAVELFPLLLRYLVPL